MLNASRRTKFIASQTKMKKAATGPLRLPWRGWFIAGAPGGAGIGDWGLGIRLHAQRFRQSRIPSPESRLFHRIARPPSRFHAPSVTVARSEAHTSVLPSLMCLPYDVFCLKKQTYNTKT